MAADARRGHAVHLLRELAVPGLMLAGIGAYAADSLELSMEALLLPGALIAVTGMALLCCAAAALLRREPPKAADLAADPAGGGEDEGAGGPILAWKPWLLVGLPALLVAAMHYLGALAMLIALLFGAQLVFDRGRPLRSLALACLVTLPVYALFKYVLYARFPAGLLGLG